MNHAMKMHEVVKVKFLTFFLTSALDGGEWSLYVLTSCGLFNDSKYLDYIGPHGRIDDDLEKICKEVAMA